MRGRGFTDGGAKGGLDYDRLVVGADLLVDLGGLVGVQVIDQGGVQIHDQAFARGNAGRFLDGLSLNGHLIVCLQRVDEMHAFGQYLAGDASEHGQHSNVASAHASDGGKQQNNDHKCRKGDAQKAQGGSSTAVDYSLSRV